MQENLEMIYDTIAYLKENGKEVVFDAEHFFDGYKSNAEYAMKTLDSAVQAGADCICLQMGVHSLMKFLKLLRK